MNLMSLRTRTVLKKMNLKIANTFLSIQQVVFLHVNNLEMIRNKSVHNKYTINPLL